jgi:hypothetical protein
MIRHPPFYRDWAAEMNGNFMQTYKLSTFYFQAEKYLQEQKRYKS